MSRGVLAAAVLIVTGAGAATVTWPQAATSTTSAVPEAAPLQRPPTADPVRAATLIVPSLGLRTDLTTLDVDSAGVLQPPEDPGVAGWFTGSAVPGRPGPTVIAGHVDSRAGPGIFFALRSIRVGARIEITRTDGGLAAFTVVSVDLVDKERFPTQAVYGPTPDPQLRLITCGGEFDHGARRYRGNVLVTAVASG